jgi:hypothetical protein
VALGPVVTLPASNLRLNSDRFQHRSQLVGLLAASIALVLFEVLQVPAEALGSVFVQLFEGFGSHGSGS